MKPIPQFLYSPWRLLAAALVLVSALARADAPDADEVPTLSAVTEDFEMVGRLEKQGFVLYVDRFVSNQPVLGGKVEVETAGHKSDAGFQAESGAYLLNNPEFLALLQAPGKHDLSFTLMAGNDADLLLATLIVPEAPLGAGFARWLPPGWVLGLALLLGFAYVSRRHWLPRLPGGVK